MCVCALVATVAKAQLDTLRVATPGGTGHITMDEQPCTVTWQGHIYNDVMVRGRGHTFHAYPDKQPMRLRFQKKVALTPPQPSPTGEGVELSHSTAEMAVSNKSNYKSPSPVGEGRGGVSKKWTVLAMNDDPTLMRDAVAWFIARRMGMDYAPAHRYAVVTIDRRPQGICLIADQVEAGPDRVPVGKGGFLAELDGYADGRFFHTPQHRLAVRIHYPDTYGPAFDEAAERIICFEEELNPTPTLPHGGGSLNVTSAADKAATSSKTNYNSPSHVGEGWGGVLSWFLTAELIANPDAYWSLYFYSRDAQDCIHFGPIWDSGKAFGNDARFTDTEHQRLHTFAFNAAWGRALAANPQFNAAVSQRWQSLDRQQLLQDIEDYITQLEALLHTDGTPIRLFLRTRFVYLDTVLAAPCH